jgi:hypothetical protein
MKIDSHAVCRLTSWLPLFLALSVSAVDSETNAAQKPRTKKAKPQPTFQLESVRGSVWVSRGKASQKVTGERTVRAGDRVLTGANSSVTLRGARGARAELGSVTIVELPSKKGLSAGALELQLGAVQAEAWPMILLPSGTRLVSRSEPATLDRWLALSASDDGELSRRLSGLLPKMPEKLPFREARAFQVLVVSGQLGVIEGAPALTLGPGELLKLGEKVADFIPTKIQTSEVSEALRQLGFAAREGSSR